MKRCTVRGKTQHTNWIRITVFFLLIVKQLLFQHRIQFSLYCSSYITKWDCKMQMSLIQPSLVVARVFLKRYQKTFCDAIVACIPCTKRLFSVVRKMCSFRGSFQHAKNMSRLLWRHLNTISVHAYLKDYPVWDCKAGMCELRILNLGRLREKNQLFDPWKSTGCNCIE